MSHDRITRRSAAASGAATCLAAFATMAQPVQRLPAGSTTYPVHFATGSAQLGPEGQSHYTRRGKSTLVATILGKADAVGSAEPNEHLAEKRAQAVFEALVYTNKVPENQVELRRTGEHLPFVSTADEQAESQSPVVAIILR